MGHLPRADQAAHAEPHSPACDVAGEQPGGAEDLGGADHWAPPKGGCDEAHT